MLRDKEVGLVSDKTRFEEIEYINRNNNYTPDQKQHLLTIIDSYEKNVDEIARINADDSLTPKEKDKKLQEYGKILSILETEYINRQNEFEGILPKQR